MRSDQLTLSAFCRDTYLLEKPIRQASCQQLTITLGLFDSWHGCEVIIGELCDPLANQWIVHQLQHRQPSTVKRQRGDLLAVWRYAADEHGLCEPPRRVRKVPIPRRQPDAWSHADLGKMLDAAKAIRGKYPSGIERSDWWELFLRAGYDTGLRLSDLLSLPVDTVTMRTFSITQGKTLTPMVRRLSPATIAVALRTAHIHRELLLPWNYRRETLWEHWRRYILRPANLPTDRRQGPQKLRRTSASHLERIAPGSAQMHLGHSTPGLAGKHYIDPTVAGCDPPLPPPWQPGK